MISICGTFLASCLMFILSPPAAGRETAEEIVAREPQPVDLVGDKGAELLAPPREAANRSVRLGFEFLPLLDLLEARRLWRLPSRDRRAAEGVAAEAPRGAGLGQLGHGLDGCRRDRGCGRRWPVVAAPAARRRRARIRRGSHRVDGALDLVEALLRLLEAGK